MQMKRYYARDAFTMEEKEDVTRKSDNRCCHCGKPIFAGYGATMDHFIPLDKGGSNRFINLIALCNDCNQEKDNKLVSIDYVPYLLDKYKNQINDYVESYISVMDYVKRNRLLAYDEYGISINMATSDYSGHKKNSVPISKCKIKLATMNDLNKLHNYLVNYLKKNNSLDSVQAARYNIIFWLQFGCIYYVEKNNEVSIMIAMTIKQVTPNEDFRGSACIPHIYVFPYYSTNISTSIVANLSYDIPLHILKEADLNFLPINLLMLEKDKMASKISTYHKIVENKVDYYGFSCMRYVVGDTNVSSENIALKPEEMSNFELKTYNFLQKFEDITDELASYFSKYADRESISWMINGIMSPELAINTPLAKYIFEDDSEEENELDNRKDKENE